MSYFDEGVKVKEILVWETFADIKIIPTSKDLMVYILRE